MPGWVWGHTDALPQRGLPPAVPALHGAMQSANFGCTGWESTKVGDVTKTNASFGPQPST